MKKLTIKLYAMKRLFYLFALVVAIFTFDATAAFGQASLVRGVVVDATDSMPVVGADVVIYSIGDDPVVVGMVKTDAHGCFEVAVNVRYYSVEVLMKGYYIKTMPQFAPYFYDGAFNEIITVWLTSDENAILVDKNGYDMLMNYYRQWMYVE